MKFVALASSSKGNAYILEHEGAAILIDCGIPYCNFKNIAVDAILITHSHTDHTSGLPVFLKHRDIPVYANMLTAETIIGDLGVDESAFVCFENGQSFSIGPFSVLPFSIPHDTADPVGYLIKAGNQTYFHGTDIGTPLDSIGEKLAEADIATLESNHDPELLRMSGRSQMLIQRIAGPRGHLSNDQAAELVRKYASPKLKELHLAHLSRDCNTPGVAECTMLAMLYEMGREDVLLEVLDP